MHAFSSATAPPAAVREGDETGGPVGSRSRWTEVGLTLGFRVVTRTSPAPKTMPQSPGTSVGRTPEDLFLKFLNPRGKLLANFAFVCCIVKCRFLWLRILNGSDLVKPFRKGCENLFDAFRPVLSADQQSVAGVDDDQPTDAQQGDVLGGVG